jgi:hypothetical protein
MTHCEVDGRRRVAGTLGEKRGKGRKGRARRGKQGEHAVNSSKYSLSQPPTMSTPDSAEQTGFLATLLQPGSSLDPRFLNILDAAFTALFIVFLILAFATAGNPHIFALMFIELALWASVKWWVGFGLFYKHYISQHHPHQQVCARTQVKQSRRKRG